MQDFSAEVLQRLTRIETKLDEQIQRTENHIADDHNIFHGNGKPGLLIEHAQLMSAFKWWRWIIGSTFAAILVVLGEIFFVGHK